MMPRKPVYAVCATVAHTDGLCQNSKMWSQVFHHLHCVSKNTLMLHTITSTHTNRFC